MTSKPESTETYTELIEDISKVDQIQLKNYLQSHKLEKNWEVDKRLVHIKCICVTFI
jgi:hypothetical protein